jgi:hypothetical protein
MPLKSVTNAYERILTKFVFDEPSDFCEDFAQRRFYKKMANSSSLSKADLRSQCWEQWISHDEELPDVQHPPSPWYDVRESLKRLPNIKLSDIGFPQGSEVVPTHGHNSLEAKLCNSEWTCTADCVDLFIDIAYRHHGLKVAGRRRYLSWAKKKGFDKRKLMLMDREFWKEFSNSSEPGKEIFKEKMFRSGTLKLVYGSRFSTVPKTTLKDRPINIEPFCNLVVQRTIGNGIRKILKHNLNCDLDTLASSHRRWISNVDKIATIDLKNCSDAISLSLCRFLLPRRLLHMIEQSRSFMIYGVDDQYHVPRKVSSMGNGFTFELMTLILLSLARQLDKSASVFGDDIIIKREEANKLIYCLEYVGFTVNTEKSFIDGPFRESCGANFHKDFGYIESYDFLIPKSIGDCVVITNKLARLSNIYPSFAKLYTTLLRALPRSLHGGTNTWFLKEDLLNLVSVSHDEAPSFPLYFVTPRCFKQYKVPWKVVDRLTEYQLDPLSYYVVPGFQFVSKLRSPTVRHLSSNRHWAKYLMYLAAGRRCNDVLTDQGVWTKIWFVTSGDRDFRINTLKQRDP